MPVTVRPSPVSLLPSSFLPTSRFPHPSLNPTPKPSGSTLILARVFPFKLRYLGLTTRVRFDSGSNRASRGPNETQMSDWVSELRMGSVFTGEDAAPVTKKRVKDANLSGNNGNEFGDTGRDRSDTKRMSKGGNLGGWGGRGRGGNLRRGVSNDLGTSNPRFGKRFGSEFDQENGRDDEKDSGLRSRTGAGRGGMRGGSSSGRKRGGGGRVGDRADSGRGGQAFFVVDEKKKKTVSGFMDLIGEEDSDSDLDLDGDRDEIEIGRRSSMFLREDKGESGMPSSSGADDSYLTETRFDQCAISPLTLKAIKDIGYEKMTVVQEASLPSILNGKDVMAKAKTGTGKTVAFLLPSIEVVVNSPRADHNQKRPPILVLVICPTRELACQAAAEGKTLLKYHSSVGVQVVIGGTNLAAEQKRMQANPCQILIATPGRLRDHIENTAGFATRLMGVKVLVLDEADHLLDMGFRRDIERIISAVPKQRQTLLFSATIPDEVRQISHVALKRDHEFINTVQEGAEDTHSKVRQMHLVAPLEKHFPLLYVILKDHISDDANYKVIVFCTTAMVTKLVAEVLGELNLNVREIHSRKTQSYRTRVSDEFRKSTGLILVTSDVSARGVDYPDVTLVIQLGLPSDREQYIHRLGRTGRKGKEGHGILLLAQWEEFFLSSIKDLPITKAPAPTVDPDANRKVERALSQIEMKSKESAYQAWLGYYNSNKIIGRDKTRLVELANDFSRCMGLDVPPAISRMVLGKMGLKNVPGLRSK